MPKRSKKRSRHSSHKRLPKPSRTPKLSKRATRIRTKKKNEKKKSRRRAHRSARSVHLPGTASALFRLSARTRDERQRALQAIADIRGGKSEAQALADAGVKRRLVQKWAGPALRSTRGRLLVRPHDRLLRVVYLPDPDQPDGKREVATADSRQATLVSEYWHAVRRWIRYGDAEPLLAFEGALVITASGKEISLLTNRSTLRRLAFAGVLSFESMYAK